MLGKVGEIGSRTKKLQAGGRKDLCSAYRVKCSSERRIENYKKSNVI